METVTLSTDHSDARFKVTEIPQWRADIYKFLSVRVWGNLPSTLQRALSAFYAGCYNQPYSRWIIKPYVRYYYRDKAYLNKFTPPNAKRDYESFQDFFIRRFVEIPHNPSPFVWPCEGLLCDSGRVHSLGSIQVKSDVRSIDTIFGVPDTKIPSDYFFTNVFLHNKNYHRIHAPIKGTITRIQHVPGDLVVLRPWIYKQNPSLPAFRNERYNIDLTDDVGRTWYLSIVGGPAVGTIALPEGIALGNRIDKLTELALFYLGSTCCMASPEPPRFHFKNTFVEVGATY